VPFLQQDQCYIRVWWVRPAGSQKEPGTGRLTGRARHLAATEPTPMRRSHCRLRPPTAARLATLALRNEEAVTDNDDTMDLISTPLARCAIHAPRPSSAASSLRPTHAWATEKVFAWRISGLGGLQFRRTRSRQSGEQ
jgi:hypothetical protein